MSTTTARQSRSRRVYDPDRASVGPSTKAARRVDPDVKAERDSQRDELREMDREMSATPGYAAAHIDSQRHMPGSKSAPLGHPRKERKFPAPGSRRVPVTGWQKRQRLVAAKQAQTATPRSELRATDGLLNEDATWARVNDKLSETTGNAHEIGTDERTVRRVDRMIQRAERRNDRSHVVYSNVLIPGEMPNSRVYASSFAEGEVVDFDRYTVAAHNIHETEDEIIGHDRLVTFEIATRRGAYMGGGAASADTHHLLPRGLRLVVVGKESVRYLRPDGSSGRRTVVQLSDVPE